MSQIITFNVGGKHYDVSRSLLEKYPNTILAIAESEIGDDDDSNHHPEPIFIERDSKRFRYVLDYMRDGNVSLPASVSRKAFIRDLDYLGFYNLPLGSIPNDVINPLIPNDLQYEYGVQFHQIIWDVSRSTPHVRFDKNNCLVKHHQDCGIVFGRTGFSSGIHFWNVKILVGPCLIGVETDNVTKAWHIHPIDDPSLLMNGDTAKTDDIIGILLNMNEMHVTEYRNGQRMSEIPVLPGIQYPCARFSGKNSIMSCEIPFEIKIFHFPNDEETIIDNPIDIPKELRCIVDMEYHQITWNPSKVAQGLFLANDNRHVVKRTHNTVWEWHAVQGLQGFTHGVHYWSFRIVTTMVTASIMIGICSNVNTTRSYYAGMDKNGGSYCNNGLYYYWNYGTGSYGREYGPTFTNGDVISTMLDMTHKIVIFYKNGIRCGCATRFRCYHSHGPGIPLLSADIYYPCVSLRANGDEVYSCEVSHD